MRTAIGRCGDLNILKNNIEDIHKQGLTNISFDLIYGIPGQTLKNWINDLQTACFFPISHLSAYALTLEEQTILAKKKLSNPCKEETIITMWKKTNEILQENINISRYEISNYAKPGFECKHNSFFWEGDTYLGCGPAAVSSSGTIKTINPSDLNLWLTTKKQKQEIYSNEEYAREILTLKLRTRFFLVR